MEEKRYEIEYIELENKMTNYEKLFQEQMQDPEFAKAYHESRRERVYA